MYAIMLQRNEHAYLRLLQILRQYAPEFQPKEMMSDFEQALQNSLRQTFPEAKLHGCYFHFCKVSN